LAIILSSLRARVLLLIAISFAVLLICAGALAQVPAAGTKAGQAYPTHEIRFIVPFPPGGGNDIVGRIVARKLQESLGKEVIVENRGGAGGTIGTGIAAKARPDGYTMLINNISLAVNATLFPKLPYDTQKDLTPISIAGRQPSVVLVRADLEAKSVRELVRLARNKPGQLIYGSGGPGSSSHLATERLLLVSGMQMTHVPYKGLDEAVTDLASGRVDMVITTASTALLQMSNRNVRALAVTTTRRSKLFPQLPTMIEEGVPGYEVSTWYALLVPAGTPQQIVARLNVALGRIAKATEVKELFAANGLDTDHTTPEQARAYIKSEIEKWGAVVRASGIKPQ
jgi:tripartite-type tricarboxylate transporter receptor subunit TctC